MRLRGKAANNGRRHGMEAIRHRRAEPLQDLDDQVDDEDRSETDAKGDELDDKELAMPLAQRYKRFIQDKNGCPC
jgi:hypothetical protein